MHNTEDKRFWVKDGQLKEREFVLHFSRLGYPFRMNPEKNFNPYAVDLLYQNKPADLKSQLAPFFKAGERFSADPQFSVSFNVKDYNNYSKNHPHLPIIFYAYWQTTSGYGYTVNPMEGIWITDMQTIKTKKGPIHSYQRRVDDPINAKDSYILDLRWMDCIFYFGA